MHICIGIPFINIIPCSIYNIIDYKYKYFKKIIRILVKIISREIILSTMFHVKHRNN